MAKKLQFLCTFTELTDPDSRGFNVKLKRKSIDIFIVRKGEEVFAYENLCPHAQAPLEWNPDNYLDEQQESIICAMHGAKFVIEDGSCVSGVCNGVGLNKLKIEISNNEIYLIS